MHLNVCTPPGLTCARGGPSPPVPGSGDMSPAGRPAGGLWVPRGADGSGGAGASTLPAQSLLEGAELVPGPGEHRKGISPGDRAPAGAAAPRLALDGCGRTRMPGVLLLFLFIYFKPASPPKKPCSRVMCVAGSIARHRHYRAHQEKEAQIPPTIAFCKDTSWRSTISSTYISIFK